MLLSVINHINIVKDLDIAGKKGLLKLVFKNIVIKDGRLKDFELYQPFKKLHEGAEIKCKTLETKIVTIIPKCVCTYVPTAAR